MEKSTRRAWLKGIAAAGGLALANSKPARASLSSLERLANNPKPYLPNNSVAEAGPSFLPQVKQVPDEGYTTLDQLAEKAKLVAQYVLAQRKPRKGKYLDSKDLRSYDGSVLIGRDVVFVIDGIRYTVVATSLQRVNERLPDGQRISEQQPDGLGIFAQVEGKRGDVNLAYLDDHGLDGRVNKIQIFKEHKLNTFGRDIEFVDNKFDPRNLQHRQKAIMVQNAQRVYGNMLNAIVAAYR